VGDQLHVVVDVDADSRPDLLVTDDCDPTTGLGVSHWRVHKNSGAAFAMMGTELMLPAGFGDQASPGFTADQGMCGPPGDLLHLFRDVDGDGRPDLLVTDDCNDATDVGARAVTAYLQSAAGGFSAAQTIALPAGFAPDSPARTTDQECDANADQLHELLDVNGDVRPDLLVTADCDGATDLGTTHFLLYALRCGS
jgi:hypothetical protein